MWLGALVTALRPDLVVECGAYKGYTTKLLGEAVGPHGWVDAIELRKDRAEVAELACKGLPVRVHTMRTLEFVPESPIDLIFYDSDMESRKQELTHFKRYASNRCVWVMHDSRDHKVQALLKDLAADGVISYVNLPTPRGVTIGRYLG